MPNGYGRCDERNERSETSPSIVILMLNTEAPQGDHPDLDQYSTAQLVGVLVGDHAVAVAAVRAAAPVLTRAVDAAVPRLAAGGRLIYAGAGTSGRLGVLDSVELPPTFGWSRERAPALIAGGEGALLQAVEGAEDSESDGRADMAALMPTAKDVATVVSASGSTPYALGALAAARRAGALTISLANNPHAPLLAAADIAVLLDTGCEVISGSTRLKAGTAQKIALNTLSSTIMVRLGKVYGNLMVDLSATNAKLRRRALALTMRAGGVEAARAERVLAECDGQVKTAIVVLRRGASVDQARAWLDMADGNVRAALQWP